MGIAKGHNPNHPVKGSTIRVDPIMDLRAIAQIKELLAVDHLHLCLFILGINTNLRASDLLAIKVSQVNSLKPMEELALKEKKTGKLRKVSLNAACIDAIELALKTRRELFIPSEYLFAGQRGVWTIPSVSRMVKTWCRKVGLKGNYGAHSLRKTWAYQQYTQFGVKVPVLMKCLNHSSERQVLTYIGIQEKEVRGVFENEL